MLLSVVIVGYNSKLLIGECLLSVMKACAAIDSEIIVVDNNSSDGTNEYLTANFPRVKIIINDKNLGFAKACNQGGKVTSGKYILS